MGRIWLMAGLCLLLAAPAVLAQTDDAKAKALAEELLDRGAKLFDSMDAEAMAATYVDKAIVIMVTKEQDTEAYQPEMVQGHDAIVDLYKKAFENRSAETRSRNTVSRALFVKPDLLLIEGTFAFDVEQGDFIGFSQLRAKQGEHWRIVTLEFMTIK